MNRVSRSCVQLRPRWRPWAWWGAALITTVLLAWVLWAAMPAAPAGGAVSPAPGPHATLVFLFVLPALMFAAFAALALRASNQRRQLVEALRATRLQVQSMDELLDVWQWQTDAQHRLVQIRPPHGAPQADWSAVATPGLLWERFATDDPSALRAQLEGAVALNGVAARLAGAAGDTRHGELRARPRSDAAGAFAGYHGTFRERDAVPAAAPAALFAAPPASTAPAGAVEAEQESFSYTISHDLRAPIRVVEGFTKIVKEDYGRLLDRVGNDHLDRVLGAAARMNNMIDALLALSKLSSQPLARQTVNLSQLAGYVADDLRRQWPERVVKVDIEAGVQVQGDATLLRVVIENLLGNAWKYTSKCADPRISFERSPKGADYFTVRDNGAGFDMRFSDRLFGVFQRLHSANDFPGTGVGLASVRRIVRRHGGEIWGEAEVNQGARFHFSLPQG
ncbi:MAG: ATP-binding protein [Burkholderiales bacterium]|nr:ATP-binding protein [Burkholderiales bacterium]